jgi:hypothetical protein
MKVTVAVDKPKVTVFTTDHLVDDFIVIQE